MTQDLTFKWQGAARLFAGDAPIARGHLSERRGFRPITCHPSAVALSELADAMLAGDSFCVADRAMPKGVTVAPPDFLTLTGGSSGSPKTIQRAQAAWIASFEVNAQQFNLTPKDSLAVLGKLSHSLTLYGVIEALYLGLDTFVLADYHPAQQCDMLRQRAISMLYATPTQLRLLCKAAQGRPLPALRLILCGGGRLDSPTTNAIRSLCPNAALHQFYGAAETSFITMTDASTPQGAQGHPYPGVSLRILDDKGGETTNIGEVWVKSPYLFEGYISGYSPHTRWQDGYLSVGEMGRLDAEGALHLTGRKSRMINIADQIIYPEAIENFLNARPNLPTCAILPIADTLRGQRLAAVLEGAQDATLATQVRQTCRGKFGALATPAQVLFIDQMPLLASGKIDLPSLGHWVAAQQ